MTNRVGQQLGNYKLIKLLGQGGFADVYLGEHIYLKTQAAIKVLQLRLNSGSIQGFLNEAQTIARLRHNNIIRVLEFGIEEDNPYLVMDYAPNGTLRQRHPKGSRLPLSTIVPYVKQIASALQYAHDQKLIHRDVKPENFLLGGNDEVLLSDFGIATLDQDTSFIGTNQSVVAGTIPYMAPEQMNGKPRSATDQYALGVIVYEWLCGRTPFLGSFAEIASAHVTASPPSLRKQVSDISPALEYVVLKALAKVPQKRFASVQAFANALEQVQLQERPAQSFNKIGLPENASSLPFTAMSQSSAPTEEITPAQFIPPTKSIDEFTTIQMPANSPQALSSTAGVPPYASYKKCLVCGTNNDLDDPFCSNCGSNIMYNTAPTQQANLPIDQTFNAASFPQNKDKPTGWELPPQSPYQPDAWDSQPYGRTVPSPWITQFPAKSPVYGPGSCPFCGGETRAGDKFCLSCGNRLPGDPYSTQGSSSDTPTYLAEIDNPGTIGTHFAPNWATVAPADQSVGNDQSVIALPPPVIMEDYGNLSTDAIKGQLFKEGDEHYKAKRYKEAINVYQRIIQIDAQDVYAYGKKGNALGKLGHTQEAVDAYTTALKIDDKHASLWSSKGDMLAKLHAYDEALAAYNKALDLESRDAVTWAHKGNVQHKLKNYQEAVVAYDAALAVNPRDAEAWTAKGNALSILERYDEALIAYICSLDHAPKKAANWEAKGDVLSKLKRFAEALLAYERAHILNPNKSALQHKCDMHRELKHRQEELERKEHEEEESKRRQEELDKNRQQEEQERKRQQQGDPQIRTVRFSSPKRRPLLRNKPDETQLVQIFDVFLSYSQEDAPWVEELAGDLEDEGGLQVWLDKWILIPGKPWISAKAEAIEQARSCVVCIGAETPVSWFEHEIQKAVNRQTTDANFSVIPILLPTAKILLPGTENDDMKAKMKNFLELNTWVDFRKFDYSYAFHVLVSGIEGKPPGRWPPEEENVVSPDVQAERKLRQLRRFKIEGIVDESIVVEYQRQVLNKFFLSTKDSADE